MINKLRSTNFFADLVSSSEQAEDDGIEKAEEEKAIEKEDEGKISEIENQDETKILDARVLLPPTTQDVVLPCGDTPKGKIIFLLYILNTKRSEAKASTSEIKRYSE